VAKDWPQLNFAIYHSGFRHLGGAPDSPDRLTALKADYEASGGARSNRRCGFVRASG
jgi:hypothetical protein